ncbi:MAG: hypothetical protein IPJ50_07020 [Betaproteobacteria bacterium]|nr:hypothetical protein [Betaproteobacteria bacterium]
MHSCLEGRGWRKSRQLSGSGTITGDTDKPTRCNDCAHYYITHDTRFR